MEGLIEVPLEATQLSRCWAVSPLGQLGTCGFYPVPWTVQYIKAHTREEAIRRAHKVFMVDKTKI